MTDSQRVREAIASGWTGEVGLRLMIERLIRETRDDEAAKRVKLEDELSRQKASNVDLYDTNRKLRKEYEALLRK